MQSGSVAGRKRANIEVERLALKTLG